ncbi:MAG: efflux RND transporter periplasmic adaptor subunit [Mariprofundaceae bacterium]|nr:efflux RND transporter periplasmic adaptor subunit [Mariprofundaceae bacterium]
MIINRIFPIGFLFLMIALPLQAAENVPNEPLPSLFSMGNNSDISGRVRAIQYAELSSVMDARIKRITVQEGSGFRKGGLLIEFDCALENAELSRATATYETATERAQISQELVELDSISKLELVTAKSEAVKARAEQRIWQEKVRRCRIYAPYNGHVAALHVQAYEYARAGDKLMKILDDTQFEVEALIPSNWLTSMTMGMPFSLVIDETGMTYQAAVKNIGAEIDSVSQTVKLVGIIQGDTRGLITGMSGRLIMPFSEGDR